MNVFYILLPIAIATQINGSVFEDRIGVGNDDIEASDDADLSDDVASQRLVINALSDIFRPKKRLRWHGSDSKDEMFETDGVDQEDDDLNTISDSRINIDNDQVGTTINQQPAFTYQAPKPITAHDVDTNVKPPLGVPPNDFRFYQKDFSAPRSASHPAALHADDTIDIASIRKPYERSSKTEHVKKFGDEANGSVVVVGDGVSKQSMMSLIPFPVSRNNIARKLHSYFNSETIIVIFYSVTCAFLVILLVTSVLIFRNLRKKIIDAEEVDYPAYGVTGPNKEAPTPTSDRNLAHSAQMYHYQHQKQQIISMEKEPNPKISRKGTESGSEEDDTVYECPGLAPMSGEMEVKNPMFQEEDEVKSSATSTDENQKKILPDSKKSSTKN